MIKYHLHMEPLTWGATPGRKEAPLVSRRHYRGLARAQLRYCLGFSKRFAGIFTSLSVFSPAPLEE